jgi:hypothetical protein
LARLLHHSRFADRQRHHWILGRATGWQRHRSAEAKLAIKAWVRRDGKWVTLPAKDLVPGDVIRLRWGDIVPAMHACWTATRFLSISPP